MDSLLGGFAPKLSGVHQSGSSPEKRRTALEAKRKLGYDALGVMEKPLEGNDFFVGGRCSEADLALYAYTHVADEGASISRTSRQSACGWSVSRHSLDTYR